MPANTILQEDYHPGKYLAFKLAERSRAELLSIFPPKHERVICHHVTVEFHMTQARYGDLMDRFAASDLTVEAVGYSSFDDLEVISVRVNGSALRQVGYYHITHSLGGYRKPKESNDELSKVFGAPQLVLEKPINLEGCLQLIWK